MHSLLTGAVLVGLWALLVKPEWALLAVPIHLFGDRALFGNSLKPFGVRFEPAAHPAFVEFERTYATAGPGRTTQPDTAAGPASKRQGVSDAVGA
jgi:hypothetical protein